MKTFNYVIGNTNIEIPEKLYEYIQDLEEERLELLEKTRTLKDFLEIEIDHAEAWSIISDEVEKGNLEGFILRVRATLDKC